MTEQVAKTSEHPNYWVPHPVVIDQIQHEIPGVTTYDLAFLDSATAGDYRFAPGQFNMLYVPGVGEVPISLSADPRSRRTWAHTIRAAGNTTRSIEKLGLGATLGMRGPYGTGWPMELATGKDVLLVTGGIGLAPLRPVIYELISRRSDFGRITLLYGARSPDTMLYVKEFPEWARHGIEIQTTVDRSSLDWQGNVGVVSLLLARLSWLDSESSIAMACGPEVMMRYTVMAARDQGFRDDQIWVSLERNMQCAVGMCGHCQLGSEFVCKDGPVFRYDAVASFMSVEGL